MFENQKTYHNLMRNVAESTKLGGNFIGTSYGGNFAILCAVLVLLIA
jgi:hypothetical protein